MSPLDRVWLFSRYYSVFSALETFVIIALYKSTFTIPYHTTAKGRWCMQTEVQRKEIAEDTVEELNRCLDQLENIQSTRNVGSMAVHKVHITHNLFTVS